jgi:uncharacterized membrane protein YvlD (DUF360 family)
MTDCSTTLKHISIACFTGFIGDAMLQALTKFWGMGGKTGWGLIEYFRLHGAAESMFIASGMMTLFYVLYLVVFGFPAKWYYLGIYGIVLDLIFRKTMLFSSLTGYYKQLNYFWSGFWGAVPMMMPLGIIYLLDYIDTTKK